MLNKFDKIPVLHIPSVFSRSSAKEDDKGDQSDYSITRIVLQGSQITGVDLITGEQGPGK